MPAPAAVLAPAPPARLRLNARLGTGQLDGGWWPRTTDVAAELLALLDAVPRSLGRISRMSLCMSDWPEPHPMRSSQRGLPVKLGWFALMDPHTVTLGSSGFGALRLVLLVVPAGSTDAQAEDALVRSSATSWEHATQVLVPHPRAVSA